jgi:hypothetical protein
MIITGLMESPLATNPWFLWAYTNIQLPLDASFYAMLAPIIFATAFRAFKVRNLEVALMLIAAIFTMLGNAPVGTATWAGFGQIREWLYNVPNAAGMAGIVIGMGLGAVVTGIRTLLGQQRGVSTVVGAE